MAINFEELLNHTRLVTSTMTLEKYNYLKQHLSISPFRKARLAILKGNGANEELLIRVEYSYLFDSYANSFYKWWRNDVWGTKEYESLAEFADKVLEQALMNQNTQKNDTIRR